MKKRSLCLAVALFFLLSGLLLGLAQALLVPHDPLANPEAFLIRDYMESDASADQVVFVGDCEVYESFSPVTLWQNYGIEARVCGSPQQLLWHSYAVLCEVLERSSPDVVVLGVYGLCYGEPQSEAYNRMALDALPLTGTKWQVIQDAMTDGEWALSYVFPLLRYHARWSELTWRDVTGLFEDYEAVSSRGYLVQNGVRPADRPTPDHQGALLPVDTTFGKMALDYFDRIVSLCRENGAQLILIKAPTDSWRYPWPDEYEEQVRALADAYGLSYYNFLDDFEDIGLDLTTDSYDGGFHLNVSGAEKLSLWFGRILAEQHGVLDGRADTDAVARWQSEIERYEKMKRGEVGA